MFIAAVFIIGKTWKQPKCPLTDEWINSSIYAHTHNGIYSGIKKSERNEFLSCLSGNKSDQYS